LRAGDTGDIDHRPGTMSVFTAAELACPRTKPRLARIAAVTLFQPVSSYQRRETS
jgi:hypothetical protein